MADERDELTDVERRLAALLVERFGPGARRRVRPPEPTPVDEPPRPPGQEREEDP